MARNVLGTTLQVCSLDPLTGFVRNGCCDTGPEDLGSHTVCTQVTEEFLAFSMSRGNDLSTPKPEYGFAGLKPGDRWCLHVLRWKEALAAGKAPRIAILSTSRAALEFVSLDDLKRHAFDLT